MCSLNMVENFLNKQIFKSHLELPVLKRLAAVGNVFLLWMISFTRAWYTSNWLKWPYNPSQINQQQLFGSPRSLLMPFVLGFEVKYCWLLQSGKPLAFFRALYTCQRLTNRIGTSASRCSWCVYFQQQMECKNCVWFIFVVFKYNCITFVILCIFVINRMILIIWG